MLDISQHLALTVRAVKCVTFFALPRQQNSNSFNSARGTQQPGCPKQKCSRLCWQQQPWTCFIFIYQDCLKNHPSAQMCVSDGVFVCTVMLSPDVTHVKLITYHCISTCWYITAVIQLKNLPQGHSSLLGVSCDLIPRLYYWTICSKSF